MRRGRLDLLRLPIDPRQVEPREGAGDHAEHGPCPAADVKKTLAGRIGKIGEDQPLPPLFGLLDKPGLLLGRIAMEVAREGGRIVHRKRS